MYKKDDSKGLLFANFILWSGIILSCSIFSYALMRSHLHPPGSMNKYYITSLVSAILFAFVLLKSRNEFKVYFTFLLVITCSILYITETILHYKKALLNKRALLSASSTIMKRNKETKLSVMMELREKGFDVYPHYPPQGYMHLNEKNGISFKGEKVFPLSFISNVQTIFCKHENGKYVIFKSDEHGFNNPQNIYGESDIDIILIGDSNAEGFCVKPGKDTAGWLRKRGRRALTFGMQSSGPLIELAILKEYGKALKPRTVFWLYSEVNDEINISSEKVSLFLMKYLNKDFSQNLFYKQELLDNAITAFLEKLIADREKNEERFNKYNENIYNIPLSKTLKQIVKLSLVRKAIGIAKECSVIIDPLFKEVLNEAKKTVSNWGGQLYFIYLPEGERWKREKFNICRRRYMNSHKDEVFMIMKELGVPVIDIHEIFNSHSDPMSLFNSVDKVHFNSEGHSLIAQQIDKVFSK